MFILDVVSCGGIEGIPVIIPGITSLVVNVIKIAVPVVLIIFGMIDLGKAVMQQKEDDIKKAQGLFFKRLIAAVLVFFVVAIVQLIFGLLAKAAGPEGVDDKNNIANCISCFINGTKDCNK